MAVRLLLDERDMRFYGLEIDVVGIVGLGQCLLVLVLAAHDDVAEQWQTGTGGDEVAADNVLLHALEVVNASADGCFVEHLGGLLEGGG